MTEISRTLVFGEQLGETDENIEATFEYCKDFTGDGRDDVKVTFSVAPDSNSGTEDIIGVAFDVSSTTGLEVSDITNGAAADGEVGSLVANDGIDNGALGLVIQGGGVDTPYDVAVRFNDGNAGGAGDGITQTGSFILSTSGTDLDASVLFPAGSDFYIRLQRTDGGEKSAKEAGVIGEGDLPPCTDPFDVSGTKYTDLTGNGVTSDDTPLADVTVFIDEDGSGGLNAGDPSTTTASDGTWSFTGLDDSHVGKTVYEVLPNGYVQTVGNAGYTLSGTDQTGLDFANFELFDVSGTKYKDLTGNGVTGDDTPLADVTVFIDEDGSGDRSAGDPSTTTASDGTWSFTGLDYSHAGMKVYEVLPSGYAQTVGNAGYAITGTSGTDQTGLDFANFELFDVSGTKYLDRTYNGITADDGRLDGVTIFIDEDGSGGLNAGDPSTTTASDGTWSFTDLDNTVVGKTLYEVLPDGYVQTVGNAGYTLSGADQTGLDFANYLKENGTAQTPGFWKNWPEKFNQETSGEFTAAGHPALKIDTAGGYETYFGVNALGSSKSVSFLGALSASGGGESAFLRASAAAFANATTDEINYQIDEYQITNFAGSNAASHLGTLNAIDTNDDDHISVAEVRALVADIYTTGGAWNPTQFTSVGAALDAMNNMTHLDSSQIIA